MVPYREEHILEVQICIESSLIAADRVLQANHGRVISEDRRRRYVNPILLVKFGLVLFCIADCQTRRR
jgi:hypothetical protein